MRMLNALTVDVEEYFHPNAMDGVVAPEAWDRWPSRVEANTQHIIAILDEHDVRATFFVLGWVAERAPGLIRQIALAGHEIACHGHLHRLAYTQDEQAFREDVRRAKATIEELTGAPVSGFRAASYSIVRSNLWALDVLIDLGFEYDASIYPVHHDIYGIADFSRRPTHVRRGAGSILEIPGSTLRVFGRNLPIAGGGYLRFAPYAFTRWALRRLNHTDTMPGIVYVHPWEIDCDQPRLPARRSARLRQYTNLHRTEPRLRALLRDFAFAPMRQAFAHAFDDGLAPRAS